MRANLHLSNSLPKSSHARKKLPDWGGPGDETMGSGQKLIKKVVLGDKSSLNLNVGGKKVKYMSAKMDEASDLSKSM